MKKEGIFLSSFRRSILRYYPNWDYYKIPDMPHNRGTFYDKEKPCDSILHINIDNFINYFPLEAKNVTGFSSFNFNKIQDNQNSYLKKYEWDKNAISYILVHYHIPRNKFFIVIPYYFISFIKSQGYNSILSKYLYSYPFTFKAFSEDKKEYFKIDTLNFKLLFTIDIKVRTQIQETLLLWFKEKVL